MRYLTRTRALVAAGTVLLTLALALLVRALLSGTSGSGETGAVATVVALGGLALAAWRLRSRPAPEDEAGDDGGDTPDSPPHRRAGRYRLVEPVPERTDADHPLAGQQVTELLSRATDTARSEGSVDAGIEHIRPALRGLLRDVLVTGGAPPSAADRAIETGTWTDDPEAAAVLSASVEPPSRPFRGRVRAWLRPGREAQARLERAADALTTAAADALATVPGEAAPRRVDIPPPSLAELRRDVDGSLRPATGPTVGRRVPPTAGPDDADGAHGQETAGDGSAAADTADAADTTGAREAASDETSAGARLALGNESEGGEPSREGEP